MKGLARHAEVSRFAVAAGAAAACEAMLVQLGRMHGSTAEERAMRLPGDDIVPDPVVVTNHAITIDASVECVWPWVVQMGWGRAGWYTARWVDRLLFPANGPSATEVLPELQRLAVGDFVPDGPPETGTGFTVETLVPNEVLVLHSTSHLPMSWRANRRAALDWSWVFALRALDGEATTRYLLRSRWATSPWWLSLGGWVTIVPADFVMSRDHLHGVKARAEGLAASRARSVAA
jgi:hypothetical protein